LNVDETIQTTEVACRQHTCTKRLTSIDPLSRCPNNRRTNNKLDRAVGRVSGEGHPVVKNASGTRRSQRQSGFTLIELMVVVAIVAVLAAIAYPSYTSHLRKGRRAEAQAYMMDIAQREQQYFTDTRTYAVDTGGVTAASVLNAPATPQDLGGYYTITTAAGTVTPSFVITATAIGQQQVDGNLTIDNTGAKTPAGSW
jgi:type IV pilus assembly protein PilE